MPDDKISGMIDNEHSKRATSLMPLLDPVAETVLELVEAHDPVVGQTLSKSLLIHPDALSNLYVKNAVGSPIISAIEEEEKPQMADLLRPCT